MNSTQLYPVHNTETQLITHFDISWSSRRACSPKETATFVQELNDAIQQAYILTEKWKGISIWEFRKQLK